MSEFQPAIRVSVVAQLLACLLICMALVMPLVYESYGLFLFPLRCCLLSVMLRFPLQRVRTILCLTEYCYE